MMNASNSNDLIKSTTFEVIENIQGSSFELINGEMISSLNINSVEYEAVGLCGNFASWVGGMLGNTGLYNESIRK